VLGLQECKNVKALVIKGCFCLTPVKTETFFLVGLQELGVYLLGFGFLFWDGTKKAPNGKLIYFEYNIV